MKIFLSDCLLGRCGQTYLKKKKIPLIKKSTWNVLGQKQLIKCFTRHQIFFLPQISFFNDKKCEGSEDRGGLDHEVACVIQPEGIKKLQGLRQPKDGSRCRVVSTLWRPRERRKD